MQTGYFPKKFVQLLRFFICVTNVLSFYKPIPIGILYDNAVDPPELLTAFRLAIRNHNAISTFNLTHVSRSVIYSNPLNLSNAICEAMMEGVFAFFGTDGAESYNVVKSYSTNFHMPFIIPSSIPKLHQNAHESYILQVRPQYTRAVADLIIEHGWSNFTYMYNSRDGLLRLENIVENLHEKDGSAKKLDVDIRHVADPNNAYEVLRQMDTVDFSGESEKHIILDFSSDKITQGILRQVKEMGMNRYRYHFIVGTLAIRDLDLDGFFYSGVNLTGFQLLNPKDINLRLFLNEQWVRLPPGEWPGAGTANISFVGAVMYDAVHAMGQALKDIKMENSDAFRWTYRRGEMYNKNGSIKGISCSASPLIAWEYGWDIMRALKRVRYRGLTGHFSFDDGQRKDVTLGIWSVKEKVGLVKIGNWTASTGIVATHDSILNNSLNGRKVVPPKRVSSIINEPFLMYKKQPSENGEPLIGNDRFEGYIIDLTRNIAAHARFDYTINLVKDGKWGAIMENSNDSWNGMIGELTRNEADLVVAPLTITSARERVVDFSKPFMNLGISIMIKKPMKEKPGVFSFMNPLASRVWWSISGACLVVSLVLFIVSRISPSEWVVERDIVFGTCINNDYNFWNSLWYALGAFMRQGSDSSPRSVAGRIVSSAWSLFTLILISSYTANLAAFLTIERMKTPINSVEELAAQTAIKYGTIDSGSTKAFFERNRLEIYKKMWNFMVAEKPSVFVATTNQGVEKVRSSNGKYAFLLESTMNEFTNQQKPCNTMKVGDNLDSKGYGIATPLHSDLRFMVNLAVLELLEKEVLSQLYAEWWFRKSECVHDTQQDSKQSALSLSNLAGVFYILLGGLGLALGVSLVEYEYKSRQHQKQRMQSQFNHHHIRPNPAISVRSSDDEVDGADRYNSRYHDRYNDGHNDRYNDRYSTQYSDSYTGKTLSSYTYTAPAPLVSYDGHDGASHTDV